jgi:hypothetical protein
VCVRVCAPAPPFYKFICLRALNLGAPIGCDRGPAIPIRFPIVVRAATRLNLLPIQPLPAEGSLRSHIKPKTGSPRSSHLASSLSAIQTAPHSASTAATTS